VRGTGFVRFIDLDVASFKALNQTTVILYPNVLLHLLYVNCHCIFFKSLLTAFFRDVVGLNG